jgi:hypothetical protein
MDVFDDGHSKAGIRSLLMIRKKSPKRRKGRTRTSQGVAYWRSLMAQPSQISPSSSGMRSPRPSQRLLKRSPPHCHKVASVHNALVKVARQTAHDGRSLCERDRIDDALASERAHDPRATSRHSSRRNPRSLSVTPARPATRQRAVMLARGQMQTSSRRCGYRKWSRTNQRSIRRTIRS